MWIFSSNVTGMPVFISICSSDEVGMWQLYIQFVNSTSISNNPIVTEMMPDSSLLLFYQDEEYAIGNASMLLIRCNQQRYICLR